MIDVVTANIGIMESLITRMGILSLPGALLLGIENIILSTTADSTFLNEKCSDNGYCLGAKRSRLHSNPKSFAKSLILSTVLLPTETMKLLRFSATIFSY